MSQSIDFETPENVRLSYRAAGLGSRFVAWFVDNIFVTLVMILIAIIFIVIAIAADSTIDVWIKEVLDSSIDEDAMTEEQIGLQIGMILLGIFYVIWGLGSFIYYFLTELLMRGQTPGKKMMQMRVIKSDGFSLDAGSIFIRNLFRPVDQFPLLWVVPLVSTNSKRFGDMVGGTIVVSTAEQLMSPLREELLKRKRGDETFRFLGTTLERLTDTDMKSLEEFCERMGDLKRDRRQSLLAVMVPSLAIKLNVDEPPAEEREDFLLDLLTAEYRRQERRLG